MLFIVVLSISFDICHGCRMLGFFCKIRKKFFTTRTRKDENTKFIINPFRAFVIIFFFRFIRVGFRVV